MFQRPFPTGEPEIAGFRGETPDRRAAAQAAGAANAPTLGRRAYEKGLQAFVWRAEDDNRDDLTYDIMYRREGETAWKPLSKGLTDTIFGPDGVESQHPLAHVHQHGSALEWIP